MKWYRIAKVPKEVQTVRESAAMLRCYQCSVRNKLHTQGSRAMDKGRAKLRHLSTYCHHIYHHHKTPLCQFTVLPAPLMSVLPTTTPFSPLPQGSCVRAPTRLHYWHQLEHLHRTVQQRPVAGRAVRHAGPDSGTDCHIQDRASHWNRAEWRKRALFLSRLIPVRVWQHLSTRFVCHVSEIPTLYRAFKTFNWACNCHSISWSCDTLCCRSNWRVETRDIIVRLSLLGTKLGVKYIYSSNAKEITFINCKWNKTGSYMKYKYLSCL